MKDIIHPVTTIEQPVGDGTVGVVCWTMATMSAVVS